MINWNDEMEKELLGAKKLSDFARKYNISYTTTRNKYKELGGGIRKKHTVKETEEVKATKLNEIYKIIKDVDLLLEKGYSNYVQYIKEKMAVHDKEISDYGHLLELCYDEMSEEELQKIAVNIGVVARQRRVIKNEFEFLNSFKKETQDFIIFMNKVMKTSERISNKLYATRVLKEEDKKKVLITCENNKKLVKLEEENKKLKDNNKTLLKEISNLEAYNLDAKELRSDWRKLFKELSKMEKEKLLKEAEKEYTGVNIEDIKQTVISNKILPRILVKNKLFLAKK